MGDSNKRKIVKFDFFYFDCRTPVSTNCRVKKKVLSFKGKGTWEDRKDALVRAQDFLDDLKRKGKTVSPLNLTHHNEPSYGEGE